MITEKRLYFYVLSETNLKGSGEFMIGERWSEMPSKRGNSNHILRERMWSMVREWRAVSS
jgi:hypothetical protein